MTPQQYEALRDAILMNEDCAEFVVTNEDPPVPNPAANEQAIADILNAAGYADRTQEVEAWKAKRYLIKRMRWRPIVATIDNEAAPPQLRAVCGVAVDLADDARMLTDFADPAAAPMWAALVQAGLVTQAEADEIISWSRAASDITAADVSRALRGPWE